MRSFGRKGGGRGLSLIASVTLGLLPSPCEMGSEQQRPAETINGWGTSGKGQ